MANSMYPRSRLQALALCLCLLAACAAALPQDVSAASLVEKMSLEQLDDELQVRDFHSSNFVVFLQI